MSNQSANQKRIIDVNNLPKAVKICFWFLPIIVYLLFINPQLDNDFYFLYPTGEYIITNGFPVKDFLSWHGNMDIIVQQWLSTVIYYYTYLYLGIIGTTIIQAASIVALYGLSYKLLKTISDNYFVSLAFSAFFTFFISIAFVKTRPQIFTYILIAVELLLLESFIKNGKIKYLFFLPVVSVLLINLHAAMWMMLFVFVLPYFVQSVPLKFGKIKQTPCASFVKLLVAAIAMFAVGFINPYGLKAMLYIFTSYGLPYVSSYINEMQPITFGMAEGKFLFALAVLLAFLFIRFKRGRFELRFVLLAAGTLLLSLMSGKSLPYFYITAGMLCASYFKEYEPTLKISEKENGNSNKTDWKKIIAVLTVLVIVCVGAVCFGTQSSEDNSDNGDVSQEMSMLLEDDLDPIIDYLKSNGLDNIVLFNSFNSGPYLEYNGIKTFIDARAELYFEKNNHEADYFKDLYEFEAGTLYYKDFIEKYGFTHMIIQQQKYVDYYALQNDDDYEEVITGSNYSLFVKK
jgi:hypothetical protein